MNDRHLIRWLQVLHAEMNDVYVLLKEKAKNSISVMLYWKGNQYSSFRHGLIIRKLDIYSL